MIKDIDNLTFPNMYKSDFLEILWLLKREKVQSEKLKPAPVSYTHLDVYKRQNPDSPGGGKACPV